MNRNDDREIRSQRRRIDAETLEMQQEDRQEWEEADMSRPRRRRAQAHAIPPKEGRMEDTLVSLPKEARAYSPLEAGDDFAPLSARFADEGYDGEADDDMFDNRAPFYDEGDEYEVEPRGKGRLLRWVIVCTITLVLLAGVTYVGLQRPEMIEPVVKWGSELIFGPSPSPAITPEPTPVPTSAPTPIPDASMAKVVSLAASPVEQPNMEQPISFQVTTTEQTTKVRIVDNNGQILIEGLENDFTDVAYGRVWNLTVYFLSPYEGNVEAYPGNESGWNEANSSLVSIKVGDPRAVLAQEPMAGDPEPPGGVSAMPGLLSAAETKRVEVAGEVVVKGKPVEFASRESAVHMADEEMYRGNAGMNGVVTFRGSGMRQNAAYGKVAPVEKKLKQVWTASVGTPGDGHATWNTQPLIVQWQANLRELLPLYKDKLEKRWLKEVIFAGNDGSLYYVDAEDGSATRDAFPIDPPIPMLGSPSLYPTGMPLLMVGVGDPEDENPPREASLYIYNLIKHKLTAMVRSERPEARSLDLSYITSPVVDVSSSVMAAVGGNGVLYTMTLHPKIDLNDGTLLLEGATLESYVTSAGDRDMAVDSSPAAYGEYVYFATRGGILQSVHLNTLTTEWAIDLGAGTSAAVALEADHAGGQNALYTASQADGSGLAHIRRVNADTGEVLWDYALPGSCFASPLVGKGGIGGLVICTVSRSGAGAVCALDKETGAVMWEYGLGTDTMSSPVALYDDAGNAWVVQGDAAELHLLDGLTGTKLHSLPLSSPVIGSPAAFNDMIVLATQDAMLHGIALR